MNLNDGRITTTRDITDESVLSLRGKQTDFIIYFLRKIFTFYYLPDIKKCLFVVMLI